MKASYSSIEPLEARIAPAVIIVTSLADPSEMGKVTLRDALLLADSPSHPGADTIVFKLPAATAPGVNTIVLNGTELGSGGKVTIKGPGAGKLVIDGNSASRIFDFNDNATSTDSPVGISGLSVVNGKTSGNGGGIYSTESLTLKNVVISNNQAGTTYTGGVTVEGNATAGTHVSISNSLISGNTGGLGGGLGLYQLKSFSISKTVVTGNTITGIGFGAGIYAQVNSTGTGGTITGCQISGNTAYGGGGVAVREDNSATPSKITISSTKITGNTSNADNNGPLNGTRGGGGLYVTTGNVVVTGCTIENNTALYNGGGVFVSGNFNSLSISGSTISGNQTTHTNAQYQGGGGIFIQGNNTNAPQPVKITGSHITDNTSARYGGGLFAWSGTALTKDGVALTISASTISGNSASAGGGVAAADLASLTVTGGAISDNVANYGGGLSVALIDNVTISGTKLTGNIAANGTGGGMQANFSSSVVIKNVAATGNLASKYGGGLSLSSDSSFEISGGSFTGNGAKDGGGIYVSDSTGSIKGVTISGNSALSDGGGVFQTGGGTITLQIAKVTGNTAPIDANYFGPFTVFGPAAPAPAAGHGTFVVTNTSDDVNTAHSLPWALAQADLTPATVDTIAFAIPANQQVNGAWTIPLTSGLTSLGNVKITGPGAGKLIIDGGGKYQDLHFDDGNNPTDSPVTISGLSLVHGKASGSGGGIGCTESLTLKNCIISGNNAGINGGGVYVVGTAASSTVNVINCVITGNTDTPTNTIYGEAGLSLNVNKSIVITGSTITGNTATNGVTGGVYASVGANSTGITLSKDVIAGNSASDIGAGLGLRDSNLTLSSKGVPLSKINVTQCVITGNSVTGTSGKNTGGGLYCYAGNFVLSKNTISNNTAVGGGGGIEATSATSLTITGGSIDGNRVTNGYGGGLDINAGGHPLTITGTHITDNYASSFGGGINLNGAGPVKITGAFIDGNRAGSSGGGLYDKSSASTTISGGEFANNFSGSTGGGFDIYDGLAVKISTTKITGNIADDSGGGYLGANGANATVTAIGLIVSANQATNAAGGLTFGSFASAVLTLKGGAFSGNHTQGNGGGIDIQFGISGTITGAKVTGNIADTNGGGIYQSDTSTVTLGASEAALVTGNFAPSDPNTHGI